MSRMRPALFFFACLAAACGGAAPAAPAGGPADAHPDAPPPGTAAVRIDEALLRPIVADAAPTPTDLPGAEAALANGRYEAAEQAFTSLATGAEACRAKLGLARVQFETGRYDAADTTAAECESTARVAAQTLRAETLLARGRLDEAEALLTRLKADTGAHRAHVLLGRLLIDRGRASEAEAVLMLLIEAYNDHSISERDGEGLAYVGMAAHALGAFRDANDAFREAARAAPNRVETQVEWARMFLEKYDAGHAEECLRDALAVNGHHADALAVMARVHLAQGFDFAAANVKCAAAMTVNPNLVMCHVVRAGMALRDMDVPAADRFLDAALAIDPNDLEALSVRAAVRFLADDTAGFETAKRAVLARNRHYSRMYSIIAEYADWEHRYPEIVRMAREAQTLDPEDATAHATLGLNLLRMGDETEGLAALHEAWSRDRYNVQVFNTLNLYDDVITPHYETWDVAPFVFRMHREERPILEPYVVPTLRRAYDDMVRRYGFTPQGPVHIELYADPQHFSVRTTGLPNVGVQGVCFGKVVTALSPRGGPFNWGNITWHELAHVFHIQLSRNHVPRWFTEGLAEYETIVARPEWKREDDLVLWTAVDGNSLPPLRQMNSAFTHAESQQEVLTAYYASSQIVVYLVGRFGFAVVPRMLRLWGEGKPTPDVIQQALGVDIDTLDADFRADVRQRLARYRGEFVVDPARLRDVEALRAAAEAHPGDADAVALYAIALAAHGDEVRAKALAEGVVGVADTHPYARWILAQIAIGAHDAPGAEGHLRAILRGGVDGYDLRLDLARTALAQRNNAGARTELEAAIARDAQRPEAWQGMLELAADDADERLRVLDHLVRIDQHDRESLASLLELLAQRNRWPEVVSYGEMGLYVDPERAEGHRLLGEGYVRTGRAREGLVELEMALRAQHERPGLVQLGRARALLALNRRSDAQAAADAAVRADGALAAEARTVMAPRAP